MVKGVAFLWPILREEAVAQRVIAHHVLDLQGSREGTFHLPSNCSWTHPFIQHTSNSISRTPGSVRSAGGLEMDCTQVLGLGRAGKGDKQVTLKSL